MPPKATENMDGAIAPDTSTSTNTTKSKVDKADEDFKLCWAILCQMSKKGKIGGINWDEVREQIGAKAIKTTQNRYYSLRDRMNQAGCGLPEPDADAAKPIKTPTKRKEKVEASVIGEDGEKASDATPKKRKMKGEAEANGSPKKTPKTKAKQNKVTLSEKDEAKVNKAEEDAEGNILEAENTHDDKIDETEDS